MNDQDQPSDPDLDSEAINKIDSLTGWCRKPTGSGDLGPTDEPSVGIWETDEIRPKFQIPGIEVLRKIGSGGSAVVYLGYQKKFPRYVALKALPPGFLGDRKNLARFRREAATASRMLHGSILPVHDQIVYRDQPILVMPYVDGGTLEAVLKDREEIKGDLVPDRPVHPWALLNDREYVETVLPILDLIIEAIAALHEAKIIHRDVKPANVLLDQRGKPWVSDFGLARMLQEAPITRNGDGVGTRGYTPPEQREGDFDMDERVDVFALGVTLYRVLTLGFPYGLQPVSLDAPLPLLPSKRQPALPKDFDFVILKAIEPIKGRRYRDASELARAWKLARTGEGKQVPRMYRGMRWVRRQRRTIVASSFLTFMLTASAIGGLFFMGIVGGGEPRVRIEITTVPPATEIVFARLDPKSLVAPSRTLKGDWPAGSLFRFVGDPEGTTVAKLPPGLYLVEVGVRRHGMHQVFREVPEPGQTTSHPVIPPSWKRLPDGTTRLNGIAIRSSFEIGQTRKMARIDPNPGFQLSGVDINAKVKGDRRVTPLPGFDLDNREVSCREYLKVKGKLPDAMRGVGEGFDFDSSVAFVSVGEALSYAEQAGVRLPTDLEIRQVYQSHLNPMTPGTTNLLAYFASAFCDLGHDRSMTDPPILGLRTGLGEWTQTSFTGTNGGLGGNSFRVDDWIAHGAPRVVMDEGGLNLWRKSWNFEKVAMHNFARRPGLGFGFGFGFGLGLGLGFRCARSIQPLYLDVKYGPWESAEISEAANRP